MEDVSIETDFARISVQSKSKDGEHTYIFLMEHALHMLMAEYRERYGPDAVDYILIQLRGYHGKKD
ncbi:MAG: hypothetical protein M1415_07695 [Firmicutes bacterium]|jgi:hypothetical protein|nr:hypothetical protein [Bacillota bacterium]